MCLIHNPKPDSPGGNLAIVKIVTALAVDSVL